MRVSTVAVVLGLLVSPAKADDVLLQAVSFAITGSDGTDVVAVDRKQCVFRIGNDTYFLNNVYTDRISIEHWKNKLNSRWVTVAIHGKKKIIEHVSQPRKYTGSEVDQMLLREDPNYFSSDRTSTAVTDETLRVDTIESARVAKAWQYIYANGCKGMTSPF
jgi:hypothetical protein